MNIQFANQTQKGFKTWSFWIVGAALFAGLFLSILSWVEFCVEHCSANKDYHLFGLPFAPVGLAFFVVLISFHFLSRWFSLMGQLEKWMIAGALGAELMFIGVQKYQIGHWCPVCLSIALSLVIAASPFLISYISNFSSTIQSRNRGKTMNYIKKGLTSISFFLVGFLMAFVGVTKADPLAAAANDIKDRLAFGKKGSPVEVYFVTDWYCPSCRKAEPMFEKIIPEIQGKVTYFFIDYAIHTKSLNFSPYNLAFLVNNKPDYIEARHALTALAEKTESPTDKDVIAVANKSSIKFKELPYLDIKTGLDFFDKTVEKFDLDATPAVVIFNTKTNKMVKMEGTDEISEEKILKTIDSMLQ